jgi:hypothetical protein
MSDIHSIPHVMPREQWERMQCSELAQACHAPKVFAASFARHQQEMAKAKKPQPK